MAKVFYSNFVRHCMRFYARHPKPNYFRTEADKKNWKSCDNALKSFTDEDREILLTIYREGDTLSDNIYQFARQEGISQDPLWKLVNDLERKVAKRRGLL